MTTKEMIEVMQAYVDGKSIEFRVHNEGTWFDVQNPMWDWNLKDYRIKPEPKYVPYDSVTEVERDKWVKRKPNGRLYRITELDPSDNTVNIYRGWRDLKSLFNDFTYEDGTPCGKKVET